MNILNMKYLKWEYVQYEIRKLSIHFLKDIARNKKTERVYLENKVKTVGTSPNFVDNPEYAKTNKKRDKIYQQKTNGIRIRSKLLV